MEPIEIANLLSCDVGLDNGLAKEVVTIAVLRRNPESRNYEALLEIRGSEPEAGAWALPGGHVEPHEKPEDAAKRELGEETHLYPHDLHYLKTFHTSHGVKDHLFITISKGNTAKPGSDAAKVKWVSIDHIPQLAFNHNEMLQLAIQALEPEPVIEAATEVNIVERIANTLCMKPIHIAQLITEDISENNGLVLNQNELNQNAPFNVVLEAIDKLCENKIKHIISTAPKDRGKILVFEGSDGAAKSTNAQKTIDWLKEHDFKVATTKWNSSELLKDAISKGKESKSLSPWLYSLLHVADMLVRYENDIVPALYKDEIVVCDRYYYTSLVRDGIRGVNTLILEKIYSELRQPDIIFHCVCPIEIAYERILNDKSPKYYSAGMDLGLSKSLEGSLLEYLKLLDREYKKILPKQKGYVRINTNQSFKKVFKEVKETLENLEKLP